MTTSRKALRRLRTISTRLREPDGRAAAVRRVRTATAQRIAPTPLPRQASPSTKAPAPGALAIDFWFGAAWGQLASAVNGRDTPVDRTAYDPSAGRPAVAAAKRQHAAAAFADALGQGESLEHATARTVAALVAVDEWVDAWSLAEGVGRLADGGRARVVGQVVLAHRRRQLHRLWPMLRDLDDTDLATLVPVEAVDGALADGSPDARRRAAAIAGHRECFDAEAAVDLAARFLVVGEQDVAARLLDTVDDQRAANLDERRQRTRDLVRGWLGGRAHQVPTGAVPLAVIDYQSPDQVQASGNVGDYVQTLALLSNLARLQGVRFSGEDGLGELVTELQSRVRPALRLPSQAGHLHLIEVNRDFSGIEQVPEGTWMVAFGWHMHPLFDLRYDFPYHPHIRPLFVSFHVNRLDMLSDEAIAYLREHGPIGCRDWTTVWLLLSAGVDAFFSGCVTTTVNAVFPERETVYAGGGAVGLVDLSREYAGALAGQVREFTHQADDYRNMSLTQGVRAADTLLAGYQRDLSRVLTRRLHAYLPLVALGVPVSFRPWSAGDVRFPGLRDLTPDAPALHAIQDGVRDLLAQTLTAALDTNDPAVVYGRWRELTAERVADAKIRFAVTVDDVPTTVDVSSAVATCLAESRSMGPHDDIDPATVTDVVLCLDQNLAAQVAVTIESVLANASGPVRLWLLVRGLPSTYAEWLAAAFPDVALTVVPCDHVDYGNVRRIPNRITISTMDRLLLPHLLPGVHRVVYLDIDVVVLGDVCELARTDLGGTPVAARDSDVSEASEWRAAGRRLSGTLSNELMRRMGCAHGYGGAALNAGVLVLDLDRLRADGFTERGLGWVERYGLHDQDVMLAYAGPDRTVLEPRWNMLPVLEDVEDPAVIHWAGLPKPWGSRLTETPEQWQRYADRLAERVTPWDGSGSPTP